MRKEKQFRILMVVENCPFLRDPRARKEAFALQAAGYKVSAICPKATPAQPWYELIDGIAVYRYRPMPAGLQALGYAIEYSYAILAIVLLSIIVLFREGFDVIHVANPPDTLVLTVAPYKLVGKRIIYDQHDLCPELFKAKFDELGWIVPLLFWLERWSYQLADRVIVTNESYRINALTRGDVPASKIDIVRNGPELRCASSVGIDRDLRVKSENIIAYAGTIGSQDGLDGLCRILHHLKHGLGRQDFFCVIMGDGDALPEVKKLAHDLSLDNHVWFTGWIEDIARYLTYLNTADICVSPDPSTSYNCQSTFIKIMDYMAVAKPIVAFDLEETRYSAQDSALYSRAEDEQGFATILAELMDRPALRKDRGQRGQKRIREKLAWQYSIPNLLHAYASCLSSARASRGRESDPPIRRDQNNRVDGEMVEVTGVSVHGQQP